MALNLNVEKMFLDALSTVSGKSLNTHLWPSALIVVLHSLNVNVAF